MEQKTSQQQKEFEYSKGKLQKFRNEICYTLIHDPTMIRVPIDDDRTFNNPDGFAMVFDKIWKQLDARDKFATHNIDERIEKVLQNMKDHPFLQDEPEQARQIAVFRVRLLKLDTLHTSS